MNHRSPVAHDEAHLDQSMSPEPLRATPRFSIIVPTYNRPEFLREALASIRAQTITDWECIVVDDGSFTARAVIPEDSRFRLYERDRNGGGTAARQFGLEQAKGGAISFLDDDDLWIPERLELAAQGLTDADVSICWSSNFREDPGLADLSRRGRFLEGSVHHEILNGFTPSMGATAIHREVMRPFNTRFEACEDVEWWLRQTEVAKVATVPRVGHLVRRHDGVRSGNGVRARISGSHKLMIEHCGYFERNRRAKAFRLLRIASLWHALGELTAVNIYLRASLRTRPDKSSIAMLARCFINRLVQLPRSA